MDDDGRLTVRGAAADDAEALAPLMGHWGYPATPEEVRARLERIAGDADYHTLVAERGGRMIGFAGAHRSWPYNRDRPTARLIALAVEPDARGGGVGAALVAAVEAWARAQGANSLMLTTALHRAGAQAFYERLGYEHTGRRYLKMLG